MGKSSAGQNFALVLFVGFLVLLLAAGLMALSVALFAGLAMLLMNVILPLFDVNYPLTWLQAGGVGCGIVIVRAMLAGVGVTVQK